MDRRRENSQLEIPAKKIAASRERSDRDSRSVFRAEFVIYIDSFSETLISLFGVSLSVDPGQNWNECVADDEGERQPRSKHDPGVVNLSLQPLKKLDKWSN